MSNSYEWLVEDVERLKSFDGKTDVVSAVHWRCNAQDNKTPANRATHFGVQNISYKSDSEFVQFDSLTKDQLVAWAKQSLGVEVALVQKKLDEEISEKANPSLIRGLPGISASFVAVVEI